MESLKLSIIVPVYNSEKTVHIPLQSVLDNQNVDKDEIEIICINDGSTDKSLEILKTYEAKYSCVKVISQKNKGLGGARNTGIINAKGEYIIFLDADDYIVANSLKGIYSEAKDKRLDILEFEAKEVKSNGDQVFQVKALPIVGRCRGEEYIARVDFVGSACNKVYRNEFLKDNKLFFLERVYIEDIEFNIRAIVMANNIANTKQLAAHFIQTPGSITRNKSNDSLIKMVSDMTNVIVSIKDFVNKNLKKDSMPYSNLEKRISSMVAALLLRWIKLRKSKELQEEVLLKLKKNSLYPIPSTTGYKHQDFFRSVVNQEWILKLLNNFF